MQGTGLLINGLILAVLPFMSGGWWFWRTDASEGIKSTSSAASKNDVEVETLLQKAGIQKKGLLPEASEGSQELLIRLTTAKPLQNENQQQSASPVSLGIVSRRNFQEPARAKKKLKVSPNKWIVAGIGGQGELRHSALIADPLVLRAESPDANGLLSGQVLQKEQGEFLVSIPDDPLIRQLKVFRPKWTGLEYDLELMGEVPLR